MDSGKRKECKASSTFCPLDFIPQILVLFISPSSFLSHSVGGRRGEGKGNGENFSLDSIASTQ